MFIVFIKLVLHYVGIKFDCLTKFGLGSLMSLKYPKCACDLHVYS